MDDTGSGGARVNSTGAGMAWTSVRDAAVDAARRGWPVVPATCRPDEMGFPEVGPLEDTWDLAPVTDPDHVQDLWTRLRPVGVLLVGGRGIDALEVPFRVAELPPALARTGLAAPVATALAPSRWVLFVATGSGTLRDDLAAVSVRLRGTGQWVALPPTTLGGNPPVGGRKHPPRTVMPACRAPMRRNGCSLRRCTHGVPMPTPASPPPQGRRRRRTRRGWWRSLLQPTETETTTVWQLARRLEREAAWAEKEKCQRA
ncbi:MAG: bifunctional DNA primase/polymerase, partial [Pseudonocardiaceae bacterium]